MPYSSDQDASRRPTLGAPDPFASLGAAPARRRFWLIELLMAPFQDHDERASYHAAKKNSMAKNGNGASAAAVNGVAINGNGGNGHANTYAAAGGVARNGNGGNGSNGSANGYAAPAGLLPARSSNGSSNGNGNGNGNGLFSAGARRSFDH